MVLTQGEARYGVRTVARRDGLAGLVRGRALAVLALALGGGGADPYRGTWNDDTEGVWNGRT